MASFKNNPININELMIWKRNPLINPRTNRKIVNTKKTYKYILDRYNLYFPKDIDIFDSTDYSKDDDIFKEDFIEILNSKDTTKDKFDNIRDKFLNNKKIKDGDNDEIEKALEYFEKMFEAD